MLLLNIEPECYRVLQASQGRTARIDLIFAAPRGTDIRRYSIPESDEMLCMLIHHDNLNRRPGEVCILLELSS